MKKEKIVYDTKEEAENELRRILSTQRRLTERKPTRVYEYGGKWFLTSRPRIIEYK